MQSYVSLAISLSNTDVFQSWGSFLCSFSVRESCRALIVCRRGLHDVGASHNSVVIVSAVVILHSVMFVILDRLSGAIETSRSGRGD